MTFNGTWKVECFENYSKLLEKMDVNVVKRKLAEHDNLKLIISQTGDKFQINESSTFRTTDIEFTLGTPFDYTLPDGTEVNGTWVMEGDVLKGQFTRKDNGKVLVTTREVVEGKLIQSYHYEAPRRNGPYGKDLTASQKYLIARLMFIPAAIFPSIHLPTVGRPSPGPLVRFSNHPDAGGGRVKLRSNSTSVVAKGPEDTTQSNTETQRPIGKWRPKGKVFIKRDMRIGVTFGGITL
ncbi:intestinal fatty acid-binding protein [Arapaima gigas]